MLTKYRINRYSLQGDGPISKIEIKKETAAFVFLPEIKDKKQPWRGQRACREQKADNYFDTFDEAKAELVKRRERDLQTVNDERSRCINALKEAQALAPIDAE